MHLLPINITTEQREFLFGRKAKKNIDVAVQIRIAINDYIKKIEEEEK